jgi:uncharacterized RDD family membrane protein YckC
MLSFTFLYASFWRRAFACAIDFALIALISVFILDPSISFLGHREASAVVGRLPFSVLIVRVYGAWLMLTLLFAWLYFALQESSRKQATLGKRCMNLMVFTENEERMTFATASVRFWSKLISLSPAFGGFILALFDTRHRALHDRIARTQVLQPQTLSDSSESGNPDSTVLKPGFPPPIKSADLSRE